MTPIYNAILDDSIDGIRLISLVEEPAIHQSYICFNEVIKFSQDDDNHCLTGPILIPNYKILRRDAQRGEYYIVFSEDTIEKIAAKMIREGTAANVDTNHNHQMEKGIYPIEVYFKDDKRNKLVGFEDLPDKTLFVTYKVENEELYQKIKNDFNGFSVDALVTLIPESQEDTLAAILADLKKLKNVR